MQAVNEELDMNTPVESRISRVASRRSTSERRARSVFIARFRDSERNAGAEVKFRVIGGLDQKVSQALGPVHEAASLRVVFAIDAKQNVQAIVPYPMQSGRKVDELVGVFGSLETEMRAKASTAASEASGRSLHSQKKEFTAQTK